LPACTTTAEDTTMTMNRIALRELLDKGSEADLLRIAAAGRPVVDTAQHGR
jgi:hypothetical protein